MQSQLQSNRRISQKVITEILPENIDTKNLIRFRLVLAQTIAVICSLISFIYGWSQLSRQKYKIGLILNIVTFGLSAICFIILFKIIFSKKIYYFLSILINFLLVISFFTALASSIFLIQIYISDSQNLAHCNKSKTCPYYTRNSTTTFNGLNMTGCFCNNLMGTTMLGYQTTGIRCCDCPLDISCKDFDKSVCRYVNQISYQEISNIIINGILTLSSGVMQLITFIFLYD